METGREICCKIKVLKEEGGRDLLPVPSVDIKTPQSNGLVFYRNISQCTLSLSIVAVLTRQMAGILIKV